MEALVQEQNTVCMMVGTFALKTRLAMMVSDVSGVKMSIVSKISIVIMCNEIVTNNMIVVCTCFLATHLSSRLFLCTNIQNIQNIHE